MKNEISNHRYNKSIFLQNLVTRGESDNSIHEDILVSSDEIINHVMGKSIDILIANNLPLTKILCKFLDLGYQVDIETILTKLKEKL